VYVDVLTLTRAVPVNDVCSKSSSSSACNFRRCAVTSQHGRRHLQSVARCPVNNNLPVLLQ